jgi:cytochrome c oxidase subunit III
MNELTGKKTLEVQSSITMTILLVSFSMLFGTLILGYLIFRARAVQWPPMGVTIPGLFAPSLSTAFILLSSFSYFLMESSFKKLLEKRKAYFFLTELLIICFALSQFNLWSELAKVGINSDSGILGSMMYGFTWIHAGHIVIGFLLISSLYKTIFSNEVSFRGILKVKNFGLIWHFLGIIWILLYLMLFIF